MLNDNKVSGKVLLLGQIECLSPIHVGSGRDTHSDLDIIRDVEGVPLIPATSFIGVLRHVMQQHTAAEVEAPQDFKNFWGYAENDDGRQSKLCCTDLCFVPNGSPAIVVRDGIRIDNATGLVEQGGKFDFELVERASRFSFTVEFTYRQNDETFVKQTVRTIYDLLAEGRVHLGARTNSGFGRIRLIKEESALYAFDFTKREDVLNWLTRKPPSENAIVAEALGKPFDMGKKPFSIITTLQLKNAMIIRSYAYEPKMPDTTQLKSGDDWVIPGSSLKGAIRARSERILNTVLDKKNAQEILRDLFGYVEEKAQDNSSENEQVEQLNEVASTNGADLKHAKKGRIRVQEIVLAQDDFPTELQTRIRVDRFTGGVIEGGLFDSMPIFAPNENKTMTLHIEIDEYKDYEAGLLLLVLKDLWSGDLAVGGEKNIGRGVFEGVRAAITWGDEEIVIERDIDKLPAADRDKLQIFVNALVEERT